MSLITCKECKKEVSDQADKCPGCGAKVPKKLTVLQWVGVGLVVLIIIGIFSGNKNEGTASVSAVASAPVPAAAALQVRSQQMAVDYDQNEARGDALYKGKLLHVTGAVMSVSKDFADDTVISLSGTNQFQTVHASIQASEETKAINLQKGTTITVQCQGAGEVVGSPMLQDCLIL